MQLSKTNSKSIFTAGKLKQFFTALHQITKGSIILKITKNGLEIDFQERSRIIP